MTQPRPARKEQHGPHGLYREAVGTSRSGDYDIEQWGMIEHIFGLVCANTTAEHDSRITVLARLRGDYD